MISLHLINTVGDFCQQEDQVCQKLIDFLTNNFEWISTQIKLHPEDPYWHHVIKLACSIRFYVSKFLSLYKG